MALRRIGEVLKPDLRLWHRVQRVLAQSKPEGYYPTKGLRLDLLGVLAAIARYQHRKFNGKGKRWGKFVMNGRDRPQVWTIVRHSAILAWYFAWLCTIGHGFTLCRRSLCYQLAGLKAAGFILSEKRHKRAPAGSGRKLDLRPSVYTFTPKGRDWVKNNASILANPFGRPAVQNFAESGFNPAEVYIKTTAESRSAASAASTERKKPAPPAVESQAKIRALLGKRPRPSGR